MSDPIDDALENAKRTLALNPASDVHTVYRGLKEINGQLTEAECVVCVVSKKLPVDQMQAANFATVPRAFFVDGCEVVTDVIEGPQPGIARLNVGHVSVFASNDLQKCHQCPLPGGVQIAPEGAQWVGTLGAAIAFPAGDGSTIFGALTNYHVAHGGQFPAGTRMVQPTQGASWFARLHSWAPINFRGGTNRIDTALLNCRRTDGAYAPKTDTVRPFQFGVGAINPDPYLAPKLGDDAIKVGRTTGVTRGKLVGVNASTTVDYGPEGAARFDGQFIFRSSQGQFSQAGDSGSLILHAATLRPMALLFAGGGRDTIANPIQFVLDWAKARFFKA